LKKRDQVRLAKPGIDWKSRATGRGDLDKSVGKEALQERRRSHKPQRNEPTKVGGMDVHRGKQRRLLKRGECREAVGKEKALSCKSILRRVSGIRGRSWLRRGEISQGAE